MRDIQHHEQGKALALQKFTNSFEGRRLNARRYKVKGAWRHTATNKMAVCMCSQMEKTARTDFSPPPTNPMCIIKEDLCLESSATNTA